MQCKDNCDCIIFHEETLNKAKQTIPDDINIINTSNVLKLLSDPQKLRIIHAIKYEELCVCDIGHLLGVTKSAISHQMRKLREFDLVSSNKKGKMVYYRLKNMKILDLLKDIDLFMEENTIEKNSKSS